MFQKNWNQNHFLRVPSNYAFPQKELNLDQEKFKVNLFTLYERSWSLICIADTTKEDKYWYMISGGGSRRGGEKKALW